MQGLSDPNAKVRWAACQALGQMCTDLGPKLQTAEHARILPALQRTMEDFTEPRVQSHAAAALVNFAEDCEEVSFVACTCTLQAHSTLAGCTARLRTASVSLYRMRSSCA